MCGIAGFVGRARDVGQLDADLRRMCAAIEHRGPDDEGRFTDPAGVALGMRRLSIIDVAGGHQPIANEDGSVVVVFNGEIYNHHALRAALVAQGHRFATHSDTETLVHLYEEHGDAMVDRLRGMFAFAIWDRRRERLFVARDHIGIKPLHYWPTEDGGVGFASELRSLLALERFSRPIDRASIARYLSFGYVPEPHSVFEGVKKLPPGHSLSWSRDEGIRTRRYWTPVRARGELVDEREAVEALRSLLEDSVRCHLESEVPLGAFLSGGIDSSTVVAFMVRVLGPTVRTFSIGFDDPRYDESSHAAAVAKALGTRHTELIVRPDADALVDEVVRAFDEPFADSSALPTYLVSKLARDQVTVALSGDGGDEGFGGYTRYMESEGLGELPALPRHALRAVARRLPLSTPGRNRLLDLSRRKNGRYAKQVAMALERAEGGIANAETASLVPPLESVLDQLFAETDGRGFATRMTLVDMLSYLPGDILTKVDRMSMAVSLEARVPLLDKHVLEFAAALPSGLKMRGGVGKYVLRKAIEGVVPPSVLEKPKQGFGVPLDRWFRKELRHRLDALGRADSPAHEYIDERTTRHVIGEHLVGRRDHSYLLWRLLSLDLWLRALARGDLARPTARSSSLEAAVARARAV